MIINGMTVCVGYAEHLKQTIGCWQDLDSLLVVTSPTDTQTIDLCNSYSVPAYKTLAFYRGGASFNKGAAMEEARAHMRWDNWILFFDADILPDANWRSKLKYPMTTRLNGASRYQQITTLGSRDTQSVKIQDDRVGYGYFQLFHSQDPVVQRNPLLDTSWKHAGGYDSSFIDLWAPNPAIELPVELLHIGDNGNWFGVGHQDKYNKMMAERKRIGGISKDERL